MDRRLCGLPPVAALTCLVACSVERTEVAAIVSTRELSVPADFDALRLTVSDRAVSGAAAIRFDDTVPVCGPDETGSGCYKLPLVLTLVPGDRRPSDPVTVDVQALRGGAQVLRNEATFTFRTGASMRLDFILYRACVDTDCSTSGVSCNAEGSCAPLTPAPFTGPPSVDLGAPADLGASDAVGEELGADGDVPILPDLWAVDLVSCAQVAACMGGDGCCPAGCNHNNDGDCAPVCGNGAVETGERCDDGNTLNGDGCDPSCQYTNTLSVLSGRPGGFGFADAPGVAARFTAPSSLTTDGQKLYLGDLTNQTLRQIDPVTGAVTTLAGHSYDAQSKDGVGTDGRFTHIVGVQYLKGAVYVSDGGALRKFDLASKQLSTISSSVIQLMPSSSIGTDANKIFAFTSNGLVAWNPDNPTAAPTSIASASDVNGCFDVACDGTATCYLACPFTINRVLSTGGSVTVYAGSVTGCSDNSMLTSATLNLNGTGQIAWINSHVYVAECASCFAIRDVAASGVSTLAGIGSGLLDGAAATAEFGCPTGIAVIGDPSDSGSPGSLFVADRDNNMVRKISGAAGSRIVSTLAGAPTNQAVAYSATGGANARYNTPGALTSDGTFLYVLDNNGSWIIRTAISDGSSSNVGAVLFGSLAHVLGPTIYVEALGTLNTVPASGGPSSTFLDNLDVSGMADDGVSLFVVDQAQHLIEKLTPPGKTLTLIAGSAGATDVKDDVGAMAHFKSPRGLAFDGTNLYTLDSATAAGRTLVRKIQVATGRVTTLAGADGVNGPDDGVGAAARFAGASDLATDGSRLFIADPGCGYSGCAGGGGGDANGPTIRELDLASNRVTTMVGMRGNWTTLAGVGTAAALHKPAGIVFDPGTHALYVTDNQEGVIARIR
jgi:cysteine-rich repeat protein